MKNRWAVAVAGTITMVCLGTVYSWSLFTKPLTANFGWTNTDATWPFSLAILFLGIGAIAGGRWQDRAGPRPVIVTGALLWGLGNVLAGLGTERFGMWWLRATYGVVGGLGLGLGYVTPVAAVTKWFPDRRGLASGMVVMGFGLGAFVYNNVLNKIPAFAATSQPGHTSQLMMTFVVSGLVFAVIGGLCAAYVTNPPTGGGMGGGAAAAAAIATAAIATGQEFTPAAAARTWQFYALWLMLFLNVAAGILFISAAVPIMRDLTGVAESRARAVYGLLALFNGLGRFFWGAVSDRIGRKGAYVLIYGAQVAIFFSVGHLHSLPLVSALFALVLLCYGGGFGTMPSFVADYFGTRFMGLIYGWILLAWGIAGVVGPIFAARVKDMTGSYTRAMPVVAVMLLVAMALPLVIRRPAPPSAGALSPA